MYKYQVTLTPEEYATISALIIHNDALEHDGIYMDLPTKASWAAAKIISADEAIRGGVQ